MKIEIEISKTQYKDIVEKISCALILDSALEYLISNQLNHKEILEMSDNLKRVSIRDLGVLVFDEIVKDLKQ